jgi:hypothetical protein
MEIMVEPVSSPLPSPIQSLAVTSPQEIVLEMVVEMTLEIHIRYLCHLLFGTFVDFNSVIFLEFSLWILYKASFHEG